MVVLVLSRDKISQHEFKANIKGVEHFAILGTNSNQDKASLDERIAYVNANKDQKPVVVFHALQRTIFLVPPEWNPEVGGDYPRDLHDLADVVVYTPSLIHASYGRTPTVLKGDVEVLKNLLMPGVEISVK